MCVMAVFVRNCELSAKAFPLHEVVKQFSLCCPKHRGQAYVCFCRLSHGRFSLNRTRPYDACVVVA